MKQIAFYTALISTLLFLAACAEDKGSYEYQDINEISIGGVDDEYHVIALTVPNPVIKPQLSFTQHETDDLTYSWQVDSKEICDHPALDVPINVKEGNHDAMLIITDNETTLKYFKSFKLHVETQFARGVAILSERDNGIADFGFIPMTDKGDWGAPMTNVFEKLNDKWGNLGTQPVDMALRLPGEYASNPGYYILNGGKDKVFVILDPNTLEMTRAYSLSQLPGENTQWEAHRVCDNGSTCGLLANGKIYTFDANGSDQIAAPGNSSFDIEWFDLEGHMKGYCIPGYDGKSRQFVHMTQAKGQNFTFEDIVPFNTVAGSEQTEPVVLDGLTMIAGERMYNDGGFQYNNGMWGSFGDQRGTGGEEDASTRRFIFADSKGNGHFYTYDYEVGGFYNMMYEIDIKAINSNFGVHEDRVITDLPFNAQTVCKALPYGRYWLIANGRGITREFYTNGATRNSFSLPAEVRGNVVSMVANEAEDKLYVATYDEASPDSYKGSVAVFSLDMNAGTFGKLLAYFPNICGKTRKMIVKEKQVQEYKTNI